MVRRTRLFTTLAALVLSMLAGAALLGSIEPGRSRAPAPRDLLLHARGGQTMPQVPAPAGPWRQMLVLSAADLDRHLKSGSGGDRPAEAHVTVTGSGELTVGPAWFQRRQLAGFGNRLVVCVAKPPEADVLSAAQRQTLDILLPRLCQELDLPAEDIRFESPHPAFQDLEAHLAALRRLGDALTLNQ